MAKRGPTETGIRGITRTADGKFRARFGQVALGTFNSLQEAAKAREAAAIASRASKLEEQLEAIAAQPKPLEQPRPAQKDFQGRLDDMRAKIIEMASNPHPAEALIQLCARIADEQSRVRDVIPFDDFRRLVEAADPDLFRKLPSDINVGRIMQSKEIEAQYGFWEVRKREGLQPIIVFTEQREPVFENLPDYLINNDRYPHPGYADDETVTVEELLQRQLTLGANMASRLGTVHERMSLWDFRQLCAAEEPELFRIQPTGFGKQMMSTDNQEWYGTWRCEKCTEPRANGDPAPWIIFIPR